MQDRFKFRIWYEPEQKMMLFNNLTLIDGKVSENTGGLMFKSYDHNIKDVHKCKPEDFHIMQCTGLRDKNGKLIYEADCLGHVHNVVEDLNGGYFVAGDKPLEALNSSLEVVGNIYQNTELLEE